VSEPTPPTVARAAAAESYWTRERIIEAIQLWAEEHDGKPPTAESWRREEPGYPFVGVVLRRFESWNEAITAAGFQANGSKPPRRERAPWDRDSIIAALRRTAAELGRTPKTTDWPRASDDHPNFSRIYEYFDSWIEACEAAGLEPNESSRHASASGKNSTAAERRAEEQDQPKTEPTPQPDPQPEPEPVRSFAEIAYEIALISAALDQHIDDAGEKYAEWEAAQDLVTQAGRELQQQVRLLASRMMAEDIVDYCYGEKDEELEYQAFKVIAQRLRATEKPKSGES
jgi:hypothetical protein